MTINEHIRTVIFLLLICFCQPLYAQNVQKDSFVSCQQLKNAKSYSLLRTHISPETTALKSRSDTINILNYAINLDITDLAGQTISGKAEITLTANIDNVSILHLDLLKLNIDSITQSGSVLSYTYNDTLISINLSAPLNWGDTSKVTVYYNGNPKKDPSNWGGFYFQSGYAFNLGVGFEADPHNYGRVWFPCFDNFVERSTYDFNIITSGGKRAICNGQLVNTTTISGDTIMSSWRMNYEIPTYLACVAISDYETVNMSHSGIAGTVPIELYARATDSANLKNSFANLSAAITAFENGYGAYSWNKIGYSLVPFGSGAMEHATNIAYPTYAADGSLANQDLMAHELAHQWWGNLATCETAEDMWLNEGMAVFSEFLFNEEVYGKTAYLQLVNDNHEYIMHLLHIDEKGFRALHGIPHEYTYGYHTYLKGADVAHTLRGYLGDSLFFLGLTSFLNNNKFTHMNTYTFRDHLTEATGMDLSDFFDKWVLKPGFPHFSIDSFAVAPDTIGGSTISVYVKQKLKATPYYFNNVTLEITFMDAGWNEVTESIVMSGKNGVYQFSYGPTPYIPIYAGINYYNKISDAISSEAKVLNSPGTYGFIKTATGHLSITVNSITDSALIRVEHNWTYPDANTSPSIYKLCPNRYWKIDGILPAVYSMSASAFYDGRESGSSYFDHDLFTDSTDHEDSLVLLYRTGAGEDWMEYGYYSQNKIAANDEWGQILIDSIMLGEYVFALKGDIFLNSTILGEVTNTACYGNCDGMMSVIAQGGTSPYTYLWSDVDGQSTATATGLCTGNISVTVTDASGKSKVLSDTIYQLDSLSGIVSATSESCNGCNDGSLSISAMGGATPYSYLWDDPATQTTLTANGLSDSIMYSVTITDMNGCTYTSSQLSIGKNEIKTPNGSFTTFPNPTSGEFVVRFNDQLLQQGSAITVTDLLGKTVYNQSLSSTEKQHSIDTHKWPHGLYLIMISNRDTALYTGKIIVVR